MGKWVTTFENGPGSPLMVMRRLMRCLPTPVAHDPGMPMRVGDRRAVMLAGARVVAGWVSPSDLAAWVDGHGDAWLDPIERSLGVDVGQDAAADRRAARLALKLLVAEEDGFQGIPLDRILVVPDDGGRPVLTVAGRAAGVPRVSLSHAAGWGAAALASEGLIGVDIEHERPGLDRLKRRVLAPGEHADTDAEILRLWVLKEAALKAWGVGLDLAMTGVVVEEGPPGSSIVRMPAEASSLGDARLDGEARWWRFGNAVVAVVHFMT